MRLLHSTASTLFYLLQYVKGLWFRFEGFLLFWFGFGLVWVFIPFGVEMVFSLLFAGGGSFCLFVLFFYF